MGLDAYTWLAYRLHALRKPTPVHWARLHQQFGGGFKTVRQFKATFLANLKLAMAVYPEAKVEADPAGLILHPSKPPIPERKLLSR